MKMDKAMDHGSCHEWHLFAMYLHVDLYFLSLYSLRAAGCIQTIVLYLEHYKNNAKRPLLFGLTFIEFFKISLIPFFKLLYSVIHI